MARADILSPEIDILNREYFCCLKTLESYGLWFGLINKSGFLNPPKILLMKIFLLKIVHYFN